MTFFFGFKKFCTPKNKIGVTYEISKNFFENKVKFFKIACIVGSKDMTTSMVKQAEQVAGGSLYPGFVFEFIHVELMKWPSLFFKQ